MRLERVSTGCWNDEIGKLVMPGNSFNRKRFLAIFKWGRNIYSVEREETNERGEDLFSIDLRCGVDQTN